MKFLVIVMVILFSASIVIPAYALDKRAENNKNIAEFVLDTIKLPLVLIGALVKQDHEKVKSDLDYKEHKGLRKCLR